VNVPKKSLLAPIHPAKKKDFPLIFADLKSADQRLLGICVYRRNFSEKIYGKYIKKPAALDQRAGSEKIKNLLKD
jgi:hypothetical protein